ncbi:MAG: hypothetical protein DHS20C17_27480 [Cyclobacteriaceae bacterium]|nr:MAG: hypothetical protein DHS20C17_27480 [Cyclobacteriaceae bacterium]
MIGKILRFRYPQSGLFKLALLILCFQVSQVKSQDFITGYGASAWNLTNKQVVHVTNLNDSGPGSFREALSGTDRIILFDVGGIIELSSTLRVLSNTVVAAFTAPGEYGIVCKGASMQVSGNNVAVVGLKLWLDAFSGDSDVIQVNRSSNVLIAYGSYLFGTDECLSTYAGGSTTSINMENVTFFGNLAVGANNNHHAAGGMMNGKGVDKVDFIQCVAAFNQMRNFRFAGSTSGVLQRGNQYNCVTYNWLNQAHESEGTPDVNVIGNYFKRGPRNGPKSGILVEGGRIHIADNNSDDTSGSGWTSMSTPHSTPYNYNFLTAQQSYDKLVMDKKVGWKNTPIEEAILNHIANGTMPASAGSNDGIEAISQLGGWPTINQTSTTHTYSDIEPYLLSFFDGSTPPPPPGNSVPFINPISSYPVDANEVLGPINFTIGDNETPADQLVVTAESDDQSLVRDGNIVLGGSGTNRTVTITPELDAVGTVGITLRVSDGEDEGFESFGVTISVNAPPTISAIADQSIEQNATMGPITFVVGDDKTSVDDINTSATSSNQQLVENRDLILGGSGANRTISLTPNTNMTGTATITITVSDGPNQTTGSFQLTVTQAANQAPTISDISSQTVDQGEVVGPLNFAVRDTETASSNLTVTASSDNQSLVADTDITLIGDDINRTITVTPNATSFGEAIITITVSDGELSTDEAFRVTVNPPPNTPPTITSISDQSIDQGMSVGPISFTIGDVETSANQLTVTATSNNQTLVRDNQITITGAGATRDIDLVPDPDEFGTAVITLTVSDGTDQTTTAFTLTVNQINPGNTAPSISSIGDQTIDQDQSTGAIDFTVGDAESAAGSLTLSASSSNTSLVQTSDISFGGNNANRTVTVTPDAGEFGTSNITVTVSDGSSQSTSTFTLTVNEVTPGNTAPSISSIADQTIDQDQSTGAIDFTVGDAESAAGSLTLSASSSNTSLVQTSDISFGGNNANRTVTVTPDAGEFGTSNITVTVSDGSSQSTSTFTLTVNEVATGNAAPTISSIPDQTIDQGETTAALNFTVADEESDAGSLSVVGSCSNTSLVSNRNIRFGGSGSRRTVTVTPNAGESGSAVITVSVSDGENSSTETFMLSVVEDEETEITFSITVQDANCGSSDGAIDLSVTGGVAPYDYSWSNGATTPNIENLAAGLHTITVTDALDNSRTASFVVGSIAGEGTFEVSAEIDDETCNGGDGAIELILNGDFTYLWSNGETTESIDGLKAGEYEVTVTNSAGCYVETSFRVGTLEGPDKPRIRARGNILTASDADSYQWYLNGSPIDNAQEREIVANESGEYSVVIMNGAGCSAESDALDVTVEEPSSDTDIADLRIYPNPATTTVNVDLKLNPNSNSVVIGISNLQGMPVFKQRYKNVGSSIDESINISSLPPGVYLVRVKVNNEIVRSKLIVN